MKKIELFYDDNFANLQDKVNSFLKDHPEAEVSMEAVRTDSQYSSAIVVMVTYIV
jgi:hypothetical protein